MVVRILVVEDDLSALSVLRDVLSAEGYRVKEAGTAEEAIEAVRSSPPDLVLLDWNLPGRPGVDLCRLLRTDPRTAEMPVVMLTSRDKTREKVDALETGADDYLTKPYDVAELRARVKAVLRRRTPWLAPSFPLEFGELRLDPAVYRAFLGGRDAGLTKVEFEILYMLAANAGRIVQRAYIEDHALDIEYPSETRALDVHVSRIRDKLGRRAGSWIETSRGLGYIFSGPAPKR